MMIHKFHRILGIMSRDSQFQKQVNNLSETIKSMGNPFLDDFSEFVSLNNRNCMDESVYDTVRTLEVTGKRQFNDFVKHVVDDRTRSIHEPFKRNSLALFRNPKRKVKSRQGKTIKVLQKNVALFGQLYVSMQNRESELNDFFAHRIQFFLPSLSDFGKLRLPSAKSELLDCLEPSEQDDPPSSDDCKVLDGAIIVHCLPTKAVNTFSDYAETIFIPYLKKQLQETRRLDVVWEEYVPDSLKESTRIKRGVRRKVSGNNKLPENWKDFFRDSSNKKELFSFLANKIEEITCPLSKAVYVT